MMTHLMTLQTLQNIRVFLTRVVAKGDEEQALINAVHELDKLIAKNSKPKAA
jgi:hypothetical protein